MALLTLTPILAVALIALALAPATPSTAEPGEAGVLSAVHNTAILDATFPTALGFASTLPGPAGVRPYQINGTVGFVMITGLSFEDSYTLVGPDGTVLGPLRSLGGQLTFVNVPLYKTGTWQLRSVSAPVPALEFTSVLYGDVLADGPRNVVIDAPVDPSHSREWGFDQGTWSNGSLSYCGSATAHNDATGYTLVPQTARAYLHWETPRTLEEGQYFVTTLFASSDERAFATSVLADGPGEHILQAFVPWRAGGVYEVASITKYVAPWHEGGDATRISCYSGEFVIPAT